MKPTKPGNYWYKREDVNRDWVIVNIRLENHALVRGLVIDLYGYQLTVDDVDGKWGPEIIPPRD